MPLYESDVRTVKSELATFFEAFPHATIWANTVNGEGYDMVFMGQAEPVKINLDEVQQRWDRPDYAPVAQSLHEIGVHSLTDLLSNMPARNPTSGSGAQAQRSTAIPTCVSSIWPGGASTPVWRTRSIARSCAIAACRTICFTAHRHAWTRCSPRSRQPAVDLKM